MLVQLCLHNPMASGAHWHHCWWWEILGINVGVMEDAVELSPEGRITYTELE